MLLNFNKKIKLTRAKMFSDNSIYITIKALVGYLYLKQMVEEFNTI